MIRPLLLAGCLLLAGGAQAAKPIPAAPSSYVHNEGVVSEPAAERISGLLRQVERSTGRQFVVALFQSLEGENLEAYSNRVFRTWKIGDARRNDGLLFCLFLAERGWRVEVGYGLEGTLTDLEAAEIARETGVPYFKAGDYDQGVIAVASGLAEKLGLQEAAGQKTPRRRKARWFDVVLFLVVLAFYLLFPRRRGYNIGGRGRHGGWGGGFGGGFSGGGGLSGGGGASGRW